MSLSFMLLAVTSAAVANDSSKDRRVFVSGDTRLESLESNEQGRKWEAVGRLDLGGRGFCTGALIAPNLVLTAAHCMYDKYTGARIDPSDVQFLAGWRNGRASSYRGVRRAVVHPGYDYSAEVSADRVRNDIALLELERPIRDGRIIPFETASRPRKGDRVGVVSYAMDRSEAPSLQEVCQVKARQEGVLVTSCSVDFGSSGAPIFVFEGERAQIVSVVSAKAEVEGESVSLGTSLGAPLELLRAELVAGRGFGDQRGVKSKRITIGGNREGTGAKFVKP